MRMLSPIGFPASPSTATLRQWSVLEVEDDGCPVHLLAGMLTETRMRVTSQIVQFEDGRVVTQSGSVYELDGPPATAEQLDEQRTRRDALMGGRTVVNVTERFLDPL